MAKILKGAAAGGGPRIEAAAFDAAERARDIVAAAEEDARRIRATAGEELAAARAAAAEAGRRDGLASAAAVLAAAEATRARRLAAAEREVVTLAIDVARKVLGRELATEPAAVVDLAATALSAARERRAVTLRVNPADADLIRAAAGRLEARLARAPGLALREDAAVERGGVVVETEAGRIDARIETQLAALALALGEEAP